MGYKVKRTEHAGIRREHWPTREEVKRPSAKLRRRQSREMLIRALEVMSCLPEVEDCPVDFDPDDYPLY